MCSKLQSTLTLILVLITGTALRAAAPACTNTTTTLISKATTGGAGDYDSGPEDITADGRYVAFRSTATNLVSPPLPQSAAHVYIRDRVNGTLSMLDDVNAGQGFNDQVETFTISGDGHALAFATLANNVIPNGGDTNGAGDVYVKDFRNGTYVRASLSDPSVTTAHPGVTQSAQGAVSPAVNSDASYFKSDAPLQYAPLTPCRVLDTRIFTQGPALAANDTRPVSIRGLCGVPADAKAVMMNLTVINTGGAGYVTAYPSEPRPGVATIVFAANEPAQGNGTIVPLAQPGAGDLLLFAFMPAQTHTDVAIDVFGFFR
jgi:hypothetical protein